MVVMDVFTRRIIAVPCGSLAGRTTLKTLPRRITTEAIQTLITHDFPGNIRELRNLIARACILSAAEEITSANFPVSASRILNGPQHRGARGRPACRDDPGHAQPARLSGVVGKSRNSARAKDKRRRPGGSRAPARNVA